MTSVRWTAASMAALGLPYPPYLRKVIGRSAGIWLLIRCMYVVLLMVGVSFFNFLPVAEGVASAMHPSGGTRIVVIAVTAFLTWWDRKRFHEVLLYANLGAHPGWFWAASLLTASVLDMLVQALLGVF